MAERVFGPDWRRESFASARWPGDPYPEAHQAYVHAREDEAEAWAKVERAAELAKNGVRIGHAPRYADGIEGLVASARALRDRTHDLHVALRTAEDAYPARQR